MNIFDTNFTAEEAELRYMDNDFEIVSPGTHVRCAHTGQYIHLNELKYWSVDLQEAYIDAYAAEARMKTQT